jgi:hypothetical protein
MLRAASSATLQLTLSSLRPIRVRLGAFEVGFDWLCSFGLQQRGVFHKPLCILRLRSFCYLKIGFVFSNAALQNVLALDLAFSASCFRARPGDWL